MRVVAALLLLLLQFTISVDVDVALFNLTVLDGHGNTVTGLTADNFRIYEDGREQKIKIFQPEDSPATVGLVIDNSGSMGNTVDSGSASHAPLIEADNEYLVVGTARECLRNSRS